MAKKIKRKRKMPRTMVIRVAVPASYTPDMKLYQVIGVRGERLYTLQIFNAYYDMPGQPNALA